MTDVILTALVTGFCMYDALALAHKLIERTARRA